MPRFVHEFEEEPRWGELSVDLDPPAGARIEFSDGVWIAANRAGYTHLAKIFAELGTRGLENGYHFHRTLEFGWAKGGEPEVTIELIND